MRAAARTRALRCGCSRPSSSTSHSVAAAVAKTLPPPAMTAGHTDGEQRVAGGREVGVAVADDGHVAGLERPAVPGGPGGEQAADVAGEVERDAGPHLPHGRQAVAAERGEVGGAQGPQPERRQRGAVGAEDPRRPVVGGDGADPDPGPQLGPPSSQQHLQALEERGVAAAVHDERVVVLGGAGGGEVGGDVTAAEGVDRLLRVADQHHRGVAREGAVEHGPLHGSVSWNSSTSTTDQRRRIRWRAAPASSARASASRESRSS